MTHWDYETIITKEITWITALSNVPINNIDSIVSEFLTRNSFLLQKFPDYIGKKWVNVCHALQISESESEAWDSLHPRVAAIEEKVHK